MSWTPAITLAPREPPLTAIGVVAHGNAVAGLSKATHRALARGASLRAAAAPGWLVVLGEFEALPWADGCVYVGRDGPLLIPTTRTISPPADLIATALAAAPAASSEGVAPATAAPHATPSPPSSDTATLSAPTSSSPPAPTAISSPTPTESSRPAPAALLVVLEDAVLRGPVPLRVADPETLP